MQKGNPEELHHIVDALATIQREHDGALKRNPDIAKSIEIIMDTAWARYADLMGIDKGNGPA